MSLDLLIVGSGLAGLFAANLAVDKGLTVHIVSRGQGSLSLAHGCIDIFNSANPARSIRKLPDTHPFKTTSIASLKAAIKEFRAIASGVGIEYTGGYSSSIPLLSSAGSPFRTTLVPDTMIKGRLDDTSPITIAGLENYRDFWAEKITSQAKRHGIKIRSTLVLPMLHSDIQRDLYATDIAKLLESDSFREESWRAWKPKLTGQKRVGIPAIMGIHNAVDLLREAEEYFGIELFEIPTLPPSLPGIRLEGALKERILRKGGSYTEGPDARGRIDGRSKGKLAAGVQLSSAGGLRSLNARAVLLASGGFLHGGLQAYHNGSVVESVFGAPVNNVIPRTQWTSTHFWDTQQYAYMGLETDGLMRPLDYRGKPLLENLFAVGGLLSGADRTHEGSRQGIDLATAHQAIESIVSFLN
jgi:glycerol-3-phosphate dehydrogenase subunit B